MPSIRDLTREERLRLFFAQAGQYAIIMFDPDGIIVEWPIGAENLMGWTKEEMEGKPGALIFTPEDQAAGVPQMEFDKARLYGKAADVRWHMRKDGSHFFVDGVLYTIVDKNGEMIGFGKILRDLTDRKEKIDFLTRQASLLDLSFDPAFSWDLATDRIIYWNKAAEELYGYAADEAIGHSPHVLLATVFPDQASVIKESLEKTGRWTGSLTHTRKDGTCLYVDSRMVAHHQSTGRPITLEVNRDITQQRQAEEELRQLAASLSAANRRQNEFLATLAHELRNPLAPVRTGLDLLRLSADKPEAIDKVRIMMERQVDHLVHLVNDLLDLARISSGKIELQKTRTMLRDIVLNAVETSLPAIQAKHHQFGVDLPHEPIWLDADTNRLAQIISNLLTNAAKYTPDSGKIDLKVHRLEGNAEIVITDNGIGIPVEHQSAIFEMFTQVGHGLSHSQGGLGIGLNLVNRLTEMHGGTVSVTSAGPHKGSTFVVRLPVHERGASSAMTEAPHAPETAAPKQPLRVLIADDNKDAATALADVLMLMGHIVKTAPNGVAAWQLAQQFCPDLGFLDIGMPGMNGYELAQAIRKTPELKHMALAALTGWGAKGDRDKSRSAGFDCHLTKPIDFETLNGFVTKVANGLKQ